MIGSAPRLLQELTRLAEILEIPPHFDSMSDDLLDLQNNPQPNGKTWQRYAAESYACVTLAEGCRKSIATGAALVFC